MRVLTLILGMIAVVPWLTHRNDLRRGLAAVKAREEADKRIVPTPR